MIGKKYDSEKPKMHLVPPRALLEVGKVLTFGADKYAENNWRYVVNASSRYTSAALRHILAKMSGESVDEETNLDHLAHAICCLMFELELRLEQADILDLLAKQDEELRNGESKEERLRKSDGNKYSESDHTADSFRYFAKAYHKAYHKERSLRNTEYSIQYNPIEQDYTRISGEAGVCSTAQEAEPWEVSYEWRGLGGSYSISARRKSIFDSEKPISLSGFY